jgi:apolipoprotein N-acyltransferase
MVLVSSLLLVLSFPDFNFWLLAWIGLVPLIVTIALRPEPSRSFLLGWLMGTAFFYATCYWLTYSMIRYGGIQAWQAYLLLIPAAMIAGLFPACFALVLARLVRRLGTGALFLAPASWVALEWARLSVIGQLWNAIGYSQAFHPALIQVARFGGVYAVSFLIVTVNASVAYALLQHTTRAMVIAGLIVIGAFGVVLVSNSSRFLNASDTTSNPAAVTIIALQPNVPMEPVKSAQEMQDLIRRHLLLSERALHELPNNAVARIVIWPESPMNFTYGTDSEFRNLVANFCKQHHTALLLNSQETAPDNGFYNSALLINEEGRLIAQYDKIRLMPFGEYVPLPRWLPGSNRVRSIVGEFTPGARYALMSVGKARAGVFICIEAAYPWIARTFTAEGADALINISNDGYLGPTAVMRQHLANAIFRAVENGRPLARVTNTGITAFIEPNGSIKGATTVFQTAVRTWTVAQTEAQQTFYTKHGDLFVGICAALSLFVFVLTFRQFAKTRVVGSV